MKPGRKRKAAGARVGWIVATVSKPLTDAEWAALGKAIGRGADAKVADGRSLRDALDYAINATATALVETPQLPTEREVAHQLVPHVEELKGISDDLRSAARLALNACKRLAVLRDPRLVTTVPGLSAFPANATPLFAIDRDHAPAVADSAARLLAAFEAVRDAALEAAADAERLDSNATPGSARTQWHVLTLLRSVREFMAEADANTTLPAAADYDTAHDFALFRTARAAIRIACSRAGLVDHVSVNWSDATLLDHLRVA